MLRKLLIVGSALVLGCKEKVTEDFVPIPLPPSPVSIPNDPVGSMILSDITVGSYIIYGSIAVLAALIILSFWLPLVRAFVKYPVCGILSGMMLRSIGWVQINYPAYVAIATGVVFAPFAIMLVIETYRQFKHKDSAKILANVIASPQEDMELIVNDDKSMKTYQEYKDKKK